MLRECHWPGIEPATCKSQVQRPTAEHLELTPRGTEFLPKTILVYIMAVSKRLISILYNFWMLSESCLDEHPHIQKCPVYLLVGITRTCHKMGNSASWMTPYLAMSSTAPMMSRGDGRLQPRRVGQNRSASTRTKHRRPSSSTSVAITSRASRAGSTQMYLDEPASSTLGHRTSIITP